MNSVVILFIGIISAAFGYYVYSKYIDQRIIKADPKRATPAKMYMDGVDFIPTSKHVLFGYQFKSIAAIAPVVGPIIAIQWGWLPALLWVVLGTLLIGWVQDYCSAMVGIRSEGQSFGALSYRLISPRSRLVLLGFIYFYLLLIVAIFGDMIASAMAEFAAIPIAVIGLTIAGVAAGLMTYRLRIDIILTTIIMVVISFLCIWLGLKLPILAPKLIWVIFALGFSFLGAVLPIWTYAQPINYIAFYLIFFGILGAALGVFIGHPQVTTPAVLAFVHPQMGPLWPILFVTIACGAISGWHSLVSSSGTARQLQNEQDTRYVCGGGMFLESLLAVLALVIAAATFPSFSAYAAKIKAAGPAGVFTQGMSVLLNYLCIPMEYGKAFAGAIFVILAITVVQLVVRFMRIATGELLGDILPAMRNMYVGTTVSLLLAFLLIYTGTWQYLWILFGGSNQLMAALALLLISIWLVSQHKCFVFTFLPMTFMLITTIAALTLTANKLIHSALAAQATAPMVGNSISGIIGIFLIIAALILAYDGLKAFVRYGESEKVDKLMN